MSEMKIGQEVIYQGRAFRVRGLNPMGAKSRRIFLEDLLTHEWIDVDPEALELPREIETAPDDE